MDSVNYSNSLDYFRTTPLFEWTFVVFVANFTLQAYQSAAQLATFVFDMFKLAYSKEIFGQLTNDDLKLYSQYLVSKYELAFKLGESIVLTIAAYFIAKSLLNFSVIGLGICMIVFISHDIALILGAIFLIDQFDSLFSFNSALWFVTIFIELATVILSAITIVVLFGLY